MTFQSVAFLQQLYLHQYQILGQLSALPYRGIVGWQLGAGRHEPEVSVRCGGSSGDDVWVGYKS